MNLDTSQLDRGLPHAGSASEGPEIPRPQWGPRLPYLPGVDGLRAVAVLAVLLYHADVSWLPGGFLGVEVFFVISGYLITALLVAERRREGRIDLRAFWIRRARRLLPALGLVLVAVVAVTLLFLPDEVTGMRGDVLAALTYVTNWYQILAEQSYFEATGRPPLLQHLWSLAVEEQFYLVWPVLFVVGTTKLGNRRFLWAILGGIVASTALMWLLFTPGTDPTRVYYGTDTRAAGLLVGSALAMVWPAWRLVDTPTRSGRVVIDLVGLVSLGYLLWAFASVGEFDSGLYRGGFLLVGLASAGVIAMAVHPSSRLGGRATEGSSAVWASLANPVLHWVGLRSYGLYLWHWPVFMLTRPDQDVHWPSPVVFVVRFVATFALAELSYRFIEVPVRRGAIARIVASLRSGEGGADRSRIALTGLTSVAVVGLLAVGLVRAQPPEVPEFLADGAATQLGQLPPSAEDTVPPPIDLAPDTTETTAAADTTTTTEAPAATVPQAPDIPAPVDIGRTTAIGDSVMAGAGTAVYEQLAHNVFVDAKVNRQASEGIAILTAWRDQGVLGEVVLVHLGNNGTFSAEQFDQMMGVLAGVPKVGIINNKVPRGWEESNNNVLREGAERYPNATYIDWRALSLDHPEWFYDDAIHLRPEGARAYAGLIARTFAPPPPPDPAAAPPTTAQAPAPGP